MKRLQQALKENDMEEIAVVSALMEVAVKKMDEATKKLEDYRKEREVVDSKRKKSNGTKRRKTKLKWKLLHVSLKFTQNKVIIVLKQKSSLVGAVCSTASSCSAMHMVAGSAPSPSS